MPEISKDSAASPTRENAAETQSERIARENFAKWNEALLSKDPQKVIALYSPDNTFLPTMAPEFRQGTEEAEEYFKNHFLPKSPDGTIMEAKVQELGENAYVHSGLYNFTAGPEDKRQIMEARFTYVWQKDETGDWKIIHHHSSVRPQG